MAENRIYCANPQRWGGRDEKEASFYAARPSDSRIHAQGIMDEKVITRKFHSHGAPDIFFKFDDARLM